MFPKKQAIDPLKPKNYVAILYTVIFFLFLVRLIMDVYNNETESLVRNIIWVGFMFSLSIFTWIIFKKQSTLYKKFLDFKNLM